MKKEHLYLVTTYLMSDLILISGYFSLFLMLLLPLAEHFNFDKNITDLLQLCTYLNVTIMTILYMISKFCFKKFKRSRQ